MCLEVSVTNKFKFGSVVKSKLIEEVGVVVKAETLTYLVAFEDGETYWYNEYELQAVEPSMYVNTYSFNEVYLINKRLQEYPLHKVHSITTVGDKVVVVYQA